MAGIAVIGAQWGDEGKGKIVHFLSQDADMAVRFNGGPNAGHTVQDMYGTTRLHLVPAGALRSGIGVLAHGVVVDPWVLGEELSELERQGRPKPELLLSERAHLILPYHKLQEELSLEAKKIGTTRRGIGPAYQEKTARHGLRLGDLGDADQVRKRLEAAAMELRARFGQANFDLKRTEHELRKFWEENRERVGDTQGSILAALQEGKTVLFEGAQGTLLDLDLGTYPYVTSSTTTVHGIGWGAGISMARLSRVIGVAKAYATRVGEGPFPTEEPGEVGEWLRARGGEYGATTGRPRRCGWLDLVALRYSCRVNEFTELALTKLDVLASLPEIKVCMAYRLKGRPLDRFPSFAAELGAVEPVYESLPGWEKDIREVRSYDGLPREAQDYIAVIEEAGVPVSLVGVGPGEDEIIVR
jgi:adenylosuccinate synthase